MDAGMPRVGQIIEFCESGNPRGTGRRFEIISVNPQTRLIEARACEANADGRHSHIRMKLERLH